MGTELDIDDVCADHPLARRELKALRYHVQLLTHKVITCGVAARHPDANLARTGAYADKWNSPQAEEVRKLRAAFDAAMTTLRQIESTPRNAGARRNARATLRFIETNLRPISQ